MASPASREIDSDRVTDDVRAFSYSATESLDVDRAGQGKTADSDEVTLALLMPVMPFRWMLRNNWIPTGMGLGTTPMTTMMVTA